MHDIFFLCQPDLSADAVEVAECIVRPAGTQGEKVYRCLPQQQQQQQRNVC